jgi:hypothetical protein
VDKAVFWAKATEKRDAVDKGQKTAFLSTGFWADFFEKKWKNDAFIHSFFEVIHRFERSCVQTEREKG